MNLIVGVPDKMFLFGEDVIGPILDKLLSMPMYILVAKHMPPGVEATLFALEMGLSNFGAQTGKYLGVVLLAVLGGVEPPEFVNTLKMCKFTLARRCMDGSTTDGRIGRRS